MTAIPSAGAPRSAGPAPGTPSPAARHDQRMESAPAPGAVPVVRRPGARRRARRQRCRPRNRDRGRRGVALRRGGDLRQGPRRAARRAGDHHEPALALRVRGQPGPRPGVRGGSPSPLNGRRARRPRVVPGTTDRRRSRPQLRRRGPAGAGVARRDVRHRRHRGSGPWPAGRRNRRGRADGGPRSRRRRDPAGAAGPAGRPCGARRRAPGLARRRRAERAVAPGRLRAARVASPVVDHHVCDRRCPGRGVAMTVEGIRVSGRWLAHRESADAAARAPDLIEHLGRHLPATGRRVIHDLGCGTGAMGRWLAPRLSGPQHWVVHDWDADLLEVAAADLPSPAADGAAVTVETKHSDITRLHPGDLADATLITASALLDLLTEDELAGLVAVCVGAGCPALLTLSVVGRVNLSPADPLDRRMAAAFDAHQRRTTEGGRLLGPDAVAVALKRFRRLGAKVLVRPSPWRLGALQADLAAEWFTGWVGAACEQQVELAAEADAYIRRRLAEATEGQLAVTVDHADLLVLP